MVLSSLEVFGIVLRFSRKESRVEGGCGRSRVSLLQSLEAKGWQVLESEGMSAEPPSFVDQAWHPWFFARAACISILPGYAGKTCQPAGAALLQDTGICAKVKLEVTEGDTSCWSLCFAVCALLWGFVELHLVEAAGRTMVSEGRRQAALRPGFAQTPCNLDIRSVTTTTNVSLDAAAEAERVTDCSNNDTTTYYFIVEHTVVSYDVLEYT